MLFKKKKRAPSKEKKPISKHRKDGQHKKHRSYLMEDPSIKNEAHSRSEAEDIYDEDDFDD